MAADERIHGEVLRGLAAHVAVNSCPERCGPPSSAQTTAWSATGPGAGDRATGADVRTILFTGLAGLLAGALSMGAGEYVGRCSVSFSSRLIPTRSRSRRCHI